MGRIGIPSLLPAIGMGSGIWLAYAIQPGLQPCLIAFLAAATLLGLSVRTPRTPPWLFTLLVLMAFTSLGAWAMTGRLPSNQPDHYIQQSASGPQHLVLELEEPLKPGTFSKRWTAALRELGRQEARGRVLLQLPTQTPDSLWLPGDQLLAIGRVSPPPAPLNPHQFDYASYLQTQGIYGQLRLEPGSFRHITPERRSLLSEASRLRQNLLKKVYASGLSPESRTVLAALVLGDRTRLDPELYASYQRAGAVHLLAVSGLHVGVLMGLAAWLLKPLARSRGGSLARFLLILLFLWTYAFLAGFGASVVRASLLFSFISYAHLSGRGREGPHFLGLAALVMLGLVNPFWLFQPGFQLSFAAVWSIYAFYPAMMRKWPWHKGPARSLGELLCLGNAAQLGVLPISLFYFHQFPMLYWVANLVIVPIMGVVLALGFALVTGIAAGWLPAWPAALFEGALGGINAGVRWVASLEAGLISGIRWSEVELMLAVTGLLLLSAWLARGGNWRIRLAASCLVALFGWQLKEAIQASRKLEWVVPHRTGASGLWVRQGTELTVISGEPEAYRYALGDYQTGEGIRKVRQDSLRQAYWLGSNNLWIIGPEAYFPDAGPGPDILLLRGSPRVHLDRVLQSLRPALVIADGSNYRSFAKRWEASCMARGIPFHHTATDGAYRAPLVPVSGHSPSGASSAGRLPGQ